MARNKLLTWSDLLTLDIVHSFGNQREEGMEKRNIVAKTREMQSTSCLGSMMLVKLFIIIILLRSCTDKIRR